MRASVRIVVLSACGLAVIVGCRPDAPISYEPRMQLTELASELPTPNNEFVLVERSNTAGRFACGMAIAKFAATEDANGWRVALANFKSNEEAFWSESMRGISAIRELIFLSPIDTRSDGQSIDGLCLAAERLGASLLLTYRPNRFGPNSAELMGVLYDVPARRAIATLHSSAQFTDEADQELIVDDRRGDHRDLDAAVQVAREFEHHTLACLRELIRRDKPATTTQPHDWAIPGVRRWWVPKRIRHP